MFEWMEEPTKEDADKRLTLKSRLMSHRARRKILDWKIDEAMFNIQRWEIERSETSDREDKILDALETKN